MENVIKGVDDIKTNNENNIDNLLDTKLDCRDNLDTLINYLISVEAMTYDVWENLSSAQLEVEVRNIQNWIKNYLSTESEENKNICKKAVIDAIESMDDPNFL